MRFTTVLIHTHTHTLALALALTHTRTHRHIHTHTHRHSIYSILSRCFGPLPAILIYLICYLILIYLICGIYKFTYTHIYTLWHTNFLMLLSIKPLYQYICIYHILIYQPLCYIL